MVDDLRQQRNMVLLHKNAFDEDMRLWGEGLDAGVGAGDGVTVVVGDGGLA